VGLVRRAGAEESGVIGIAVAAVALVALYAPVLRDLVSVWVSVPYYSYGTLVVPFSGYLIWESRAVLRCPAPRRAPEGLVVAALGLGVLAAGLTAGSLALRALSVPVVASGTALFFLGRERWKTIAFPLAFLGFMAPLPDAAISRLSLPLQFLAAWVTEKTLALVGIPVARDGLFVHLHSVTLHVTEACNGLRFLFAMIVVGVAFAWATQRRLAARALVVSLAITVAILANDVRVATTGLLAHGWGASAAMGFFHLAYGKVVYLALLAPFVLGAVRFRSRA